MSLVEFADSFECFITRITENEPKDKLLIYKLEMSKLNRNLLGMSEDTVASNNVKMSIQLNIAKLFEIVIQQDFLEDCLSWFLINLYLNKFIRVNCPEIKMFWPVLIKIKVYTEYIQVLHLLIEESLSGNTHVSWLASKILVNIIDEGKLHDLVKEQINTKENVSKFRLMLSKNCDITTELNLVNLFVKLNLEAVFLPNLVSPYLKYITTVNPMFKDYIPCSVSFKNSTMAGCANAFLQPVGRYLLVLWYRINQQESETYYINLLTLTNFKALPNAILRLQFNCNTNRVLRSESLSIYNYMNRFSIKNENVELLDVALELKFKDLNHYPWLINFLKSVKQNRKVSTNSTIQVPSSQVKEVGTPLRLEKKKFSSVNPLESDLTSTPKKIMKIGGKKVRSATLPEFTCVMTPEQTVTSDQVTDSVDEIEDSSVNSTHSQIHKTEVDISSEKLFVEDESFEATNISSEIGSISDSFKLFSSKIIDKLKLLEFNILERKNQLQAELDLHFAEIEAKQKRKVKQIHEYVVEELNKMK